MRNTCLNGLEGTSLLNKEQSCQSSRLHCVVMAIDDFHNFKMMTRNKALKSKEISPNGENTATRSYKPMTRPLCGPIWNAFLISICQSQSIPSFKTRVKTHLHQ